MRFVTTREFRLKPGDVWKAAQKERDIVITSKGKPIAILTAVKENDLEEELDSIRTARALKALGHIHRRVAKGITDAQIEREIKAVRESRRH